MRDIPIPHFTPGSAPGLERSRQHQAGRVGTPAQGGAVCSLPFGILDGGGMLVPLCREWPGAGWHRRRRCSQECASHGRTSLPWWLKISYHHGIPKSHPSSGRCSDGACRALVSVNQEKVPVGMEAAGPGPLSPMFKCLRGDGPFFAEGETEAGKGHGCDLLFPFLMDFVPSSSPGEGRSAPQPYCEGNPVLFPHAPQPFVNVWAGAFWG